MNMGSASWIGNHVQEKGNDMESGSATHGISATTWYPDRQKRVEEN
jgi:hypothetical protein